MGGTAGIEGVGAGVGAPVLATGVRGNIGKSLEIETEMIIVIEMGEDRIGIGIGMTVKAGVGESMGVLGEAEALHLLGKEVRSGEPGLNNGTVRGKRRCKKRLLGIMCLLLGNLV